jgi:uncharacterized protein (DUF2384 family)
LRPDATSFGRVDIPTWDHHVPQRSQTYLALDALDRHIASVLGDSHCWFETLATDDFEDVEEFPADAVSAVEFVRIHLGVSQDEVLSAAGIAERTFFGWKSEGRRPRSATQGRLWALVQVVGRLADVHPNLSVWYRGSEQAQEAFRAGDTNALANAELSWAVRNLERPQAFWVGDDDLAEGPAHPWSPVESEDLEDADLQG